MSECGEVYYGELHGLYMDYSVPRVCRRPEGHDGYHSRKADDDDEL